MTNFDLRHYEGPGLTVRNVARPLYANLKKLPASSPRIMGPRGTVLVSMMSMKRQRI